MYIKNSTIFQKMVDEVEDDRLGRLYTMAGCLIPCDCGCEVAITKPTPRIFSHGDDEYRAVEFRALCPECYTSVNFVWDASFFAD